MEPVGLGEAAAGCDSPLTAGRAAGCDSPVTAGPTPSRARAGGVGCRGRL